MTSIPGLNPQQYEAYNVYKIDAERRRLELIENRNPKLETKEEIKKVPAKVLEIIPSSTESKRLKMDKAIAEAKLKIDYILDEDIIDLLNNNKENINDYLNNHFIFLETIILDCENDCLDIIKRHVQIYLDTRIKNVVKKQLVLISEPVPKKIVVDNTTVEEHFDRLFSKPFVKDEIIDTPGKHREVEISYLENSTSGTNQDVADAIKFSYFHPLTGDRFSCNLLCNDANTKEYYKWNNSTKLWSLVERLNQGEDHMSWCFTDFVKKLERAVKILCEQMKESNDSFKENAGITCKKIRSLIGKCKTLSFQKPVWELMSNSIKVNINKNKDPITKIIPMNDGNNIDIFTNIITPRNFDTSKGAVRFTKTINAHYDPSIKSIKPDDNSTKYHKLVYDLFYKIMYEREDLVEFLIIRLGICISGDVGDKTFLLCLGEGSNGKSQLQRLLKMILGDYLRTIQPGVVFNTGARMAANAHNSELSAIKDTRAAVISDAPKADSYNNNIKRITGNDLIAIREAHDPSQVDVTFKCHLIIFANYVDTPKFNPDDPSFRGRPIVIPMLTYFYRDSPDERIFNRSIVKSYPANHDYDDIINDPNFINAAFTMMCIGCNIYYSRGKKYPIPEDVQKATDEQFEDNYPYTDFLNDYCETPKHNQKYKLSEYQVQLTTLYNAYLEYVDHIQPHNRDIFRKNLEKKFTLKTSNGVQVRPLRLKSAEQRLQQLSPQPQPHPQQSTLNIINDPKRQEEILNAEIIANNYERQILTQMTLQGLENSININ